MRPTKLEYYTKLVNTVASRSTCLHIKVGCIAVLDGIILATGYNGAPTGEPHCLDIGCARDAAGIPRKREYEVCRAVHAEQNVVAQAGSRLKGATIYCNYNPCPICSRLLRNCQVKEVIVVGNTE